jgi:regulatory protein
MLNNTPNSAMTFSLKLLSLRNHSQDELERKLLKKGYTSESIKPVLEKLTKEGVLNDKVFSMELIRSRSRRKPSGKLLLCAELRKRGVADNIIQELLNEYASAELCLKAAEKKISSLRDATESVRKKRLETFLRNRGFRWQEIQTVLKSLFGSYSEDEEPSQESSP